MLSDNEIIKALKCCVNDDEGVRGSCIKGCPLFDKDEDCPEFLRRNALDLIKRKDADIEEFKKVFDNMADKLVQKDAEIEKLTVQMNAFGAGMKIETEKAEKAQAEIERLQGLLKEWKKAGYKYADSIDLIKAESIKEFIKNFNLLLENLGDYHALCVYEIKDRLDIVKNEMVGDDNA